MLRGSSSSEQRNPNFLPDLALSMFQILHGQGKMANANCRSENGVAARPAKTPSFAEQNDPAAAATMLRRNLKCEAGKQRRFRGFPGRLQPETPRFTFRAARHGSENGWWWCNNRSRWRWRWQEATFRET